MSKGFERLRAVVAVSVAGGVAVVPALADVAKAATGVVQAINVTRAGFHASLRNPTAQTTGIVKGFTRLSNSLTDVGATGAGAGFGLFGRATSSKCSLTQPNHMTTCHVIDAVDAFAGPMVSVNGHAFQAPSGLVHVSNAGRTATTGAATMSQLKVSTRVDFLPNAVNRVVVTFKNNSRRTVRPTISVDTFLAAAIANSSNLMDTTFDSSDTWAEAADGTKAAALFARGNARIGTLHNGFVTNTYDDTYRLKIKKHKSVRLMFFFAQNTDATPHGSAELDTTASHFSNGASLKSAGLLAGLSPAVRRSIKNWTRLPRR